MDMDWFSTIVGAAIGFLASIGTMLVQQWMDKAGKIKIYCKIMQGDDPILSVGYKTSFSDSGMISLLVPIRLEIQNTTNTCRVIRDVSMWLYNGSKQVAEMIQIENVQHKQTTNGAVTSESTNEYGADKNMYSFVIQPRSIQREHCAYAFKISKDDIKKYIFDDIRLAYFDEKDRKHVFSIRKVENAWKGAPIDGDKDWILLKEC